MVDCGARRARRSQALARMAARAATGRGERRWAEEGATGPMSRGLSQRAGGAASGGDVAGAAGWLTRNRWARSQRSGTVAATDLQGETTVSNVLCKS